MNHHFGEMGDVWKHLPLAEMLRVNPPLHYWETHAGSAYYPLTASPARLHGALRFLAVAPGEPELQNCAYLQAMRAMPDFYPGSPSLATRALGQEGKYIFCDIDPESAAGLRTTTAGLEVRVIEADGVSAIAREVQVSSVDPAGVLVLIDPFEPNERWMPDSRTPLELAGWLAGAGCRVVFWYAMIRSSGAAGRATESGGLPPVSSCGAEMRSCPPPSPGPEGPGPGAVASYWPMRPAPR